jgi:hypothetical protein
MRILPREVDPSIFHMQTSGEEAGGAVSFADIGGLNEQIRELREVIELPLNPELFEWESRHRRGRVKLFWLGPWLPISTPPFSRGLGHCRHKYFGESARIIEKGLDLPEIMHPVLSLWMKLMPLDRDSLKERRPIEKFNGPSWSSSNGWL